MLGSKEINIRVVSYVIGALLMIESLFMISGLPFGWVYNPDQWHHLLIAAGITFGFGFGIWYFSRIKLVKNINKREGYLIVGFSWIVTSLFGTLPYLISGSISNFTDAYFETISGFTTTGASILSEVEDLPYDLLYWRSMTQWMGGMGIIVLSVAILPVLGIGGMQLFVAEMPGITADKLSPRITDTAKRLWGIYVMLTLIEILLLWLGEMNLFEAVCHAFATMATGGFSTRTASISAFSAYSQYVIIFFMIMAGTNFTLHYLNLHGQFRRAFKNQEYRIYLVIILVFSLVIAGGLLLQSHEHVEPVFRSALFTVVSILTTTGFVTENYLLWPFFLWFLIFILMFVGGSAGSTGGGMKIVRHYLMFNNSFKELKRAIHPQAIIPVRFNGKSVSQDIVFKVMAFFLIYLLCFAMGVMVLTLLGLNFDTAIGASIASLGNIGPGIGSVGPVDNYAALPGAAKWLLSFLMLLGRLELFTILIILSPAFWRK